MTQREQQILQLISKDPMISQQALADELNITRSSVAVHISNLLKKGYIAGKGYVLRTGHYAAVPMPRWWAVSIWTSAAGPAAALFPEIPIPVTSQ